MPKIFISYKRLDKDKVFPIVDQIRKETGIDCWIDLEGIESGDQFQNVIIDAIDNADIFVFMISHNFIAPYRDERTGKIDLRKQTFPEKEVMYALRHGKRMVPVSIDGTMVYDCKWLDFNCSGLDSIDWNDESQRGKLMRNLRQWRGVDNNGSDNCDSDSEGKFDDVPIGSLDEQPLFLGCNANFFSKWVNENLIFPESAKVNQIQGQVKLRFTVNTEGNVSNVKVLNGVDQSLDAEAVRVVSMSPKWTPGKYKGRAVNVSYTFPIIFQLK